MISRIAETSAASRAVSQIACQSMMYGLVRVLRGYRDGALAGVKPNRFNVAWASALRM